MSKMRLAFLLCLLFLSYCSAGDVVPRSTKALARMVIEKRENAFGRGGMSSFYRTMHPLHEAQTGPMRPVLHHPFARRLRDSIHKRRYIVATQDPLRAQELVGEAIEGLSKVQQAAIRRLPPRTAGEPEPPFVASNVTLPTEISDMIYAEAVYTHLCKVLKVPPTSTPQRLAVLAIARHQASLLDYLMWLGAEPNAFDEGGQPLLFCAVIFDNVVAAKRLLFYGADRTWRQEDGTSLLSIAVRQNATEMVALLIDRLNVHERWPGEQPLLFTAVQTGDARMLELFRLNGADFHVRNEYNQSLLCAALMTPVLQNVPYLILMLPEHVNEVHQGLSILWHAINARFYDVAALLVRGGANLNWQDAQGRTILTRYLSISMSDQVVQSLMTLGADINHPAVHSYFYHCIMNSDYRTIARLLRLGVDVRTVVEGYPLLYFGLTSWNSCIAHTFIRHGVSVNSRINGVPIINTPALDHKTVIRCRLLRAGATPNWVDPAGLTLLSYALRQENEDLVETLLDHGAVLPSDDVEGQAILDRFNAYESEEERNTPMQSLQ